MDNVQYWYTMKDVLAALRANGLPSTWAQIKLYKDVKLIPPTRNIVLFHRTDSPIKYSKTITDQGVSTTTPSKRAGVVVSKKEMPIFTQQDIDEIVTTVKKVRDDEQASRQVTQEGV